MSTNISLCLIDDIQVSSKGAALLQRRNGTKTDEGLQGFYGRFHFISSQHPRNQLSFCFEGTNFDLTTVLPFAFLLAE